MAEVPGPSGAAKGAALRLAGAPDWMLFLPGGGSLQTPDFILPARLELGPRFLTLVASPDATMSLGGEALGPGARVDLLLGDRVSVDQQILEVLT